VVIVRLRLRLRLRLQGTGLGPLELSSGTTPATGRSGAEVSARAWAASEAGRAVAFSIPQVGSRCRAQALQLRGGTDALCLPSK
jgi:hypothetical protein